MTTVPCPLCGGHLTITRKEELEISMLPPRHRKIYNTMLEAGPLGVPAEYLVKVVFPEPRPESAYGMLRTNICDLNRRLASINGRAVRGSRGSGYYLIKER
jgi:hypothetical protein